MRHRRQTPISRTVAEPKRMRGRVVAFCGRYFEIDCSDAPPHLRPLYLVGWQMGSARVGDTVTLAYQVTRSSGLWNVVAIHRHSSP